MQKATEYMVNAPQNKLQKISCLEESRRGFSKFVSSDLFKREEIFETYESAFLYVCSVS